MKLIIDTFAEILITRALTIPEENLKNHQMNIYKKPASSSNIY